MKRTAALALLAAVALGITALTPRTARADCPDGETHCTATGDIVRYGQCFAFLSCKRCGRNDDARKCAAGMRADWMADPRIRNRRLSETTLPAAHDAAMGIATHCTDYAFPAITKTQTRTFLQMLNSGVRYFDIRPTISKDGALRIGHVAWIGYTVDLVVKKFTARNEGCYGYNFKAMMNDINKFRTSHPSELIVLDLSHFQNFNAHDVKNSHFDEADYETVKTVLTEGIGEHLVKGERNLLDSTIGDLARSGVIVLLSDDPAAPELGFHAKSLMKKSGGYTNTNSIDKMITEQIENLQKRKDGAFHAIYWTLTMQKADIKSCMIDHYNPLAHECLGILSLASNANSNLHVLLDTIKKTGKKPNVIFSDNVSHRLTDVAIEANHR